MGAARLGACAFHDAIRLLGRRVEPTSARPGSARSISHPCVVRGTALVCIYRRPPPSQFFLTPSSIRGPWVFASIRATAGRGASQGLRFAVVSGACARHTGCLANGGLGSANGDLCVRLPNDADLSVDSGGCRASGIRYFVCDVPSASLLTCEKPGEHTAVAQMRRCANGGLQQACLASWSHSRCGELPFLSRVWPSCVVGTHGRSKIARVTWHLRRAS